MTSREELAEQIGPMLELPEHLEPLLDVIQQARESTNPSAVVQPWIEREPAIIGLLDFLQPPSDRPRDNVAGSGNISLALESAMAGAFVTGLDDHFIMSADRTLVMNRENPPTIAEAYRGLQALLGLEQTMTRVENFFAWNLGAYLDECETFFGNEFDMGQVAEQTERTYNTLITTLNVFRAFRARRRALSFTHHKEVYYAAVPDEDKNRILDTAERLLLSVADQRKLTSYTRHHGFPTGVEEILDREELLERVTIRNTRSKFIFQHNDRWWSFTGQAGDIPWGANPILNADSMEIVSRTGSNMEMEKWIPTATPAEGPAVIAEIEIVPPPEAEPVEEIREALRADQPPVHHAEIIPDERMAEAREAQPEPGHDEGTGA